MGVVSVIPDGEEFHLSGGGIAILMIHGFTGSPASIKPWAQSLHQAGFTILAPRLPGHGTNWQEMNQTRWQHWYQEVDTALTKLKSQHDRVFIAGFSMGGALALKLAAERGDEIEGLMLANPAVHDDRPIMKLVPILKYFIPSVLGRGTDVAAANPPRHSYGRTPLHALHSLQKLWRQLRNELHRVDVPLMIGYSINDHVVDPKNSETVIDSVSSIDIREVIFERSFHNVALDHDLEILVEESLNFIRDVLSGAVNRDERDLIDARFAEIISGLSLDQSTPNTYLDELNQSEADSDDAIYEGDNKPLPKLSQIQRGALLGVIGGPLYAGCVQILGFDPLGLGPWPGAIALAVGVFAFFWQLKPDNEIDDDGAAL
jgi:carboxylesterase